MGFRGVLWGGNTVNEWITSAEAARRLGIKRISVTSFIRCGHLVARQCECGHGRLICAASVAAYAETDRKRGRKAKDVLIVTPFENGVTLEKPACPGWTKPER